MILLTFKVVREGAASEHTPKAPRNHKIEIGDIFRFCDPQNGYDAISCADSVRVFLRPRAFSGACARGKIRSRIAESIAYPCRKIKKY